MASGNGNAVATIAGIQASDHRYHVAKKEEQLAILKAAGRLDNVVARYGKVPIKVAGVKTIELREWCELAQETLPIIHKKPQAASKRIEDIDYDIQLVRGGMDEYKMEVNEYGLAAADSGYDIDLLNGMTDKVLETYSRAQGRRPLKSDGIERFRRSLRAALRNQQLENLPNTVFSDQLPGWFVNLCRQCLLALDTDKKCTLNTIGSAIEALAKERGELRTQLARTRNNIIQAS